MCTNPLEFQNILTVKLDANNGDAIWESLLDNVFNEPSFIGSDYGYSVDFDPANGDVFIGGMSSNLTDNLSTYLVIRITDNPTGINDNEMINSLVTLSLNQNYPNPFNPSTTISFSTTERMENTELMIYNIKGQKVKQLVSDQLSAGQHSVVWNGTDDSGKPVSSGVYFYKLKSGNIYTQARKMILMK